MSRSRKKIPIIKDSGNVRYNKKYRTATKQALKSQLSKLELDEVGILPVEKETTNQYDICDYSFYKPEKPEALRK